MLKDNPLTPNTHHKQAMLAWLKRRWVCGKWRAHEDLGLKSFIDFNSQLWFIFVCQSLVNQNKGVKYTQCGCEGAGLTACRNRREWISASRGMIQEGVAKNNRMMLRTASQWDNLPKEVVGVPSLSTSPTQRDQTLVNAQPGAVLQRQEAVLGDRPHPSRFHRW